MVKYQLEILELAKRNVDAPISKRQSVEWIENLTQMNATCSAWVFPNYTTAHALILNLKAVNTVKDFSTQFVALMELHTTTCVSYSVLRLIFSARAHALQLEEIASAIRDTSQYVV